MMQPVRQNITDLKCVGVPDAPELFMESVRPWEGALFRHCLRLLGNVEDARDACQDALLKAYTNRHRYRQEYRFSTWLFTLATRICLNLIRRRKIITLLPVAPEAPMSAVVDPAPGPRQNASERESEWLLVRAMGQLPLRYRVPLSLFYEKEMSIAEIARMLRISPNLVKARLFRARERLHRVLKPYLETVERER